MKEWVRPCGRVLIIEREGDASFEESSICHCSSQISNNLLDCDFRCPFCSAMKSTHLPIKVQLHSFILHRDRKGTCLNPANNSTI